MAIYLVSGSRENKKTIGDLLKSELKQAILYAPDLDQLMRYTDLRIQDGYNDINLIIFDWLEKAGEMEKYMTILRESKALADVPMLFLIQDISSCKPDYSKDYGYYDVVKSPLIDIELVIRVKSLLRIADEKREKMEMEEELNRALLKIEEVQNIITTDMQSGIHNNRKFEEYFQKEWSRCQRNCWPISILAVKIDNYTEFESEFGNRVAQETFQKIAITVKDSANRPGDLAAVLSKKIIAIGLSETDKSGANHVAKKIIEKISALKIKNPAGFYSKYLTVSIGVANCLPENSYKGARKEPTKKKQNIPLEFLESAKVALQKAIQSGGNRIYVL